MDSSDFAIASILQRDEDALKTQLLEERKRGLDRDRERRVYAHDQHQQQLGNGHNVSQFHSKETATAKAQQEILDELTLLEVKALSREEYSSSMERAGELKREAKDKKQPDKAKTGSWLSESLAGRLLGVLNDYYSEQLLVFSEEEDELEPDDIVSIVKIDRSGFTAKCGPTGIRRAFRFPEPAIDLSSLVAEFIEILQSSIRDKDYTLLKARTNQALNRRRQIDKTSQFKASKPKTHAKKKGKKKKKKPAPVAVVHKLSSLEQEAKDTKASEPLEEVTEPGEPLAPGDPAAVGPRHVELQQKKKEQSNFVFYRVALVRDVPRKNEQIVKCPAGCSIKELCNRGSLKYGLRGRNRLTRVWTLEGKEITHDRSLSLLTEDDPSSPTIPTTPPTIYLGDDSVSDKSIAILQKPVKT